MKNYEKNPNYPEYLENIIWKIFEKKNFFFFNYFNYTTQKNFLQV